MQDRVDPIVRRLLQTKDSVLDPRWLADIAAGFAGSNERLQRFCSQPLAAWGYPLRPATMWAGSGVDSPGKSGGG